ncbi:MAG: biotin transporter BioY [Ruminococcus sp.]|nr:biotin transporter BioY [Ruminococcus sp.]
MEKKKPLFTVKELTFTAMFAALLAVCSWISVPLSVPITLQTFAVFAAVLLLGPKCAAASITVWILLGVVGVPVFAQFKSGISAVTGPTGGYMVGFLLMPPIYAFAVKLFGKKTAVKAVSLFVGLIVCYAFGTAWFVKVYTEDITFGGALKICVLPFAAFDIVKLALAVILEARTGRFVKLSTT